MTERNGNQENAWAMPPTWCSSLCRNAMNEVCVEHCAVKRDCSAFEEKRNLKLVDMPPFPQTYAMTKEEKFTAVTVYLAKVVDYLQGNDKPSGELISRRSTGLVRIDKSIVDIASGLEEPKNGKEQE